MVSVELETLLTLFERKWKWKLCLTLCDPRDRIPLGYAGQEIYINPAKGRQYDVNDFAGLLVKYEADVKVQYTSVNMDLQYPGGGAFWGILPPEKESSC